MAKPQVPVDVDPITGIWSSDGLPMLYVPRHFFNNLHIGVEKVLGREQYRESLYKSGYKSAWFWCEQTSKELNLSPIKCYQFYLQRLSQRGWGQFCFNKQELEQGRAEVKVSYSSFVLHQRQFEIESQNTCCYQFEGWFAGAADWASERLGWQHKFECYESDCAGCSEDSTAIDCYFTIRTIEA